MEIRRLFDAIYRKLWLVLLLVILGGGISAYISMSTNIPKYRANTSLYIMNRSKTALTGEALTYQDMVMSKQLVQDYSEIIKSRKVLTAVVKELNNPEITENMLMASIVVNLKKESNVMTVNVEWTDPKTAAAIANSVSKVFITKIRELTNIDSVGLVDEAQIAVSPVSSSSTKKIFVGFLVGLAIAFSIIYVNELFDTTIRTSEDIEKGLGLKVIGIIPEHNIR